MQKGVITQAQMKRALIVTVVLICLFGLALLFAAWQTWPILSVLWCWEACYRGRHHLHRRHPSLWLYRPGRYLGTGFLRLAERPRQLVSPSP
jgi:hypothetical protein